MSEVETKFHELWLGMVQPVDGLVVSVPVLVEAQCLSRQPPETQARLLDLCTKHGDGHAIADLGAFFAEILGHPASHFETGDAIPAEVSLWVPEGGQTLRPTMGLLREPGAHASRQSAASERYVGLVWDVPPDVELDRPETVTGPWSYPITAKLDRLLRHSRVPIGILTNRRAVRLIYAPHGESSGSITFRIDDMLETGGRPIVDAIVMLLSATRFFGVAEDKTLPRILEESRKRQADVTNELAEQVLEAIQILLRGFEVAAERDKSSHLRAAMESREGEVDPVYGGLLTVLLRLVFVLYAEDWGLLPVQSKVWSKHYSLLGLFEQLQADAGAFPDSMSRRFGAWSRLLALFRAIYLGASHDDLRLPPRRGHLFDPGRYPFLEGWGPAGGAPVNDPSARAAVRVPSVDDETVFRVLEKLVIFEGQRLSYRALDVEQLGSVYEALMGYNVVRLEHDAVALRLKNKSSAARAWVEVDALLAQPAARRAAWLGDELGFDKATAKKLADAVRTAADAKAAIDALLEIAAGKRGDRSRFVASAGRLVLQPGPERRRTSSHYTPRSLSAPIVRRTLEPLFAVMGDAPPVERILELKICDPAMGSGAFLVEACRFLADEVVKAWTRTGTLPSGDDPVLQARRLVAQRCLYGVDRNPYAVDLAKLSLWLVTLAKDLPFTFLDHALRHGDSLVGLGFDQVRSGHWRAGPQIEIAELALREALEEAIAIRHGILELAADPSPGAQREKERKVADADDALEHARLLGDLVVGAFFAHSKDKDREHERARRVDAFVAWKKSGAVEAPEQLRAWQRAVRERIPVFHWMLEFPEVFYAERRDPLDDDRRHAAACMDAFVGNPPFAGKNAIVESGGREYVDWLMATVPEVQGNPNTDLCAYFFRRAADLLGTHGAVGFIATNTIAEGDSRIVALKTLVNRGARLYEAASSMPWPGDATVSVAVVHLAMGRVTSAISQCRLDGADVAAIDTRLRGGAERADAVRLAANASRCFMGGKLVGVGLAVDLAERERLVAADPRNAEVLRPYLGGEEANRNPSGSFERYMIDFSTKSLEEAAQWPMLLQIIEEKVRPAREKDGRGTYKTYWWRPGESGGALYAALSGLSRCLACSRVTKHLVLAFKPTSWFFSEGLNVFAFDSWTAFAILQSRVHEPWARLLSSSMRSDLRYSASDCFETLPFPDPDPRAVLSALETIGERLYEFRAQYMLDENVGLTTTYNRLKDPTCAEPRIVELRRLHEEMDRAVLDAYKWSNIEVPPYCPATDEERLRLERFADEVVDRLFVLNAKRAEEERRRGATVGAKQKGSKKAGAKSSKKGATSQAELGFPGRREPVDD